MLIRGYNTREYGISYFSRLVGLLFQDPDSQLVCPTVEDEVAFGAENYAVPPEEIKRRVDENLKLMRIKRYRERNPHRLSGGEKQACALAAVITMLPKIFVLDEPTSNLDPIGSHMVLDLITSLAKRERRTLVIVEHKLAELLPLVDRVIVMNEGKIILNGTPQDFIENADKMAEIGLKPPQVSLLADKLKKYIPSIPPLLTLEEAIKFLPQILDRTKVKNSFNSLHQEKREFKSSNRPVIETQDLWHVYPGGTTALKSMNLKIYSGEYVAIVGQNGSGKTTLVKHFNGLLKPTKGRVYVYGEDTFKKRIDELSTIVGYCFQNPDFQLCCRTVEKELRFGPENVKLPEKEIEKRVKDVAEIFGLKEYFNENPFSLSKGQRQKLAVASILTMEPKILIVDEPTTGQDYKTGKNMMEFYKRLNERGRTVIIITHDMNLAAEYAKRTIVLKDGEVFMDGSTREVYSQAKKLEETYLKPPQITELFQALSDYGLPPDVLTVDEATNYVVEHIIHRGE